jgi:uncharacterized protein YjbI with pentapeptide repeats
MNLAGKDLREVRFTEVNLGDTNLTNADLTGADLRGARWHARLITREDLEVQDCSLKGTIMADGSKHP